MSSVSPWAWVAVAIVLIVAAIAIAPRFGGWLLLLVVVGMVYAAHAHNPPLI